MQADTKGASYSGEQLRQHIENLIADQTAHVQLKPDCELCAEVIRRLYALDEEKE